MAQQFNIGVAGSVELFHGGLVDTFEQ